jgi:hypothetical protein
MVDTRLAFRLVAALALVCGPSVTNAASNPKESVRLERAKGFIADEQWVRAIEELKAAVADRKEPNKDEALFWLAHSQNQASDSASALDTIGRLEREHPASPYVKVARSLRIEIAQRLKRSDFLWWTAVPPPPPPAPAAMPAPPAATPAAVPPTPRPVKARPAPPTPPAPPAPAPRVAAGTPAPPPPPPFPPPAWLPSPYVPDVDEQIQALGSLIRTDGPKVIPILRAIVIEASDPRQAGRALWVLAQSGQPEAKSAVVEVAKTGPQPVRIAAVKELGRLKGAAITNDLLQVYFTGDTRVKYQVVLSLGQREGAVALMQIAKSETDRELRDTAIVTLGEVGGSDELRTLFVKAPSDVKRPIIRGLFNARAEAELIRIAESERDPAVRQEALARLKLLGTPRALAYLEGLKQK